MLKPYFNTLLSSQQFILNYCNVWVLARNSNYK